MPLALRLNRRLIAAMSLFVLGLVTAGLTWPGRSAAATRGPETVCAGGFQADVTTGPFADLSLAGRIDLRIAPNGTVRGALIHLDKDRRHPARVATITGRSHGATVTLTFTTRSGKVLVGAGSNAGLITCSVDLKGQLHGAKHTTGVWLMTAVRQTTTSQPKASVVIPAPSFSYLCPHEIDENGDEGDILPGSRINFDGGYSYNCDTQSFETN